MEGGGAEPAARPGGLDLGVPGCVDAVQIGQGGFGVVYSAQQPRFNRAVAVKVLAVRLVEEESLARFEREVRAMGTLSGHPHIVNVYEAGRTPGGSPYIVMELASRGSLADRLERTGPLPWPEVLVIGVKLAGALEAAHRRGVLHRDVKPENILVSAFGDEPKLADFGISRLQGATQTTTGKVSASLAHAPPEILDGERPTAASDIYSLGSTLHTLLRGRPPFYVPDEAGIFALAYRIVHNPVPDLRADGVPAPVCRALEKALAKQPGDRHPTAAELGRQLQGAQSAAGLPLTPLQLDAEAAPPTMRVRVDDEPTLDATAAPAAPRQASSPSPGDAEPPTVGPAPDPAATSGRVSHGTGEKGARSTAARLLGWSPVLGVPLWVIILIIVLGSAPIIFGLIRGSGDSASSPSGSLTVRSPSSSLITGRGSPATLSFTNLAPNQQAELLVTNASGFPYISTFFQPDATGAATVGFTAPGDPGQYQTYVCPPSKSPPGCTAGPALTVT